MRHDNTLNLAEEGGQTAARAPEDLASVTAREQCQITTAGLVLPACDGSAYCPVTQV
jgi:hypothetical protein